MASGSELEQWIDKMKEEATRDSSGSFTVDIGSRLERYQQLVALNPSLAWLRATQWAHRRKATSISLQWLRPSRKFALSGTLVLK